MENFDENGFLIKASNIFVKTFTNVMLDKLIEVKHFLSDDIYDSLSAKVDDLRARNCRQMYDELNVKLIRLSSLEQIGENYVAKVSLDARYMDYVLDLNTHQVVSGQNQSRIEVHYDLEFTKSVNATAQGIVTKCPTCGHSLETNNSGLCPFCRSTYDQGDHDWVLTKLA